MYVLSIRFPTLSERDALQPLLCDVSAAADLARPTDDVEKIRAQVKAWIADPAIDVVSRPAAPALPPRRHAGGARTAIRKTHGRFCDAVPAGQSRQDRHIRDPDPRHCGRRGHNLYLLPAGIAGRLQGFLGRHPLHQLDYRYRPCNFVEIMPRLDEHLRRPTAKGATV